MYKAFFIMVPTQLLEWFTHVFTYMYVTQAELCLSRVSFLVFIVTTQTKLT